MERSLKNSYVYITVVAIAIVMISYIVDYSTKDYTPIIDSLEQNNDSLDILIDSSKVKQDSLYSKLDSINKEHEKVDSTISNTSFWDDLFFLSDSSSN